MCSGCDVGGPESEEVEESTHSAGRRGAMETALPRMRGLQSYLFIDNASATD